MVLATALIIIVALLQQVAVSTSARPATPDPLAQLIEEPPLAFDITARVYTKIYHAIPGAHQDQLVRDAIRTLEREAASPEQQLRVVMIEAELEVTEVALGRLALVEEELIAAREAAESKEGEGEAAEGGTSDRAKRASEALLADVDALRLIYTGRGDELTDDQRTNLKKRHGWFGEVALTHGLPNHDPQRSALVGKGLLLMAVLLVGMAAGLAALVAGFILLTVAIVQFSTGRVKPRFVPPAPGGSIAMETVAAFIAAFLALKLSTGFIAVYTDEQTARMFGLAMQWLLLLVVLWPVVRGMRLREGLALWGLHRGRGIAKEIGCGIVGYIACLPILLAGVLLTVILMLVYQFMRSSIGAPPAAPPSNPIIDVVAQPGGWLVLVMIFLLAVVWAPLAEEIIFRGALYRHLRARWHWLPAGLVTAFAFGIMHGYQFLMLGPVMALGFAFALLREWRGSLIASITAHAIHNGVVLAVLFTVIRLIGL